MSQIGRAAGEAFDRLLALSQTQQQSQPARPASSSLAPVPPSKQPPRHLLRRQRQIADVDPGLRQVLRSLVSGEKPWPLFLTGRAGAGKTCAALCLLDFAGGEYYTADSLCDTLIQSQQGRLEWSREGRGGTLWPEKFWASIAAAPLVVLDELGCRSQVSDANFTAIKRLIDERECRPLVVVSNHPLERIEKLYDDRIRSRLAAGTCIHLADQDRRLMP